MEGTEKLWLTNPDITHRNPIGEVVDFDKATYEIWARRIDKSGREIDIDGIETTDFNTIFEVRESDAILRINETWTIRDSLDQRYDIVAVARVRQLNGRYRILRLFSKRGK